MFCSINISFFKSYEELIADKNINAVYISLVNSMHYEIIKKCLNNQLHVICEKPFTTQYENTKELVDLANKNNLVIVETFQFRFHKQFDKIKELIKLNKIGELISISSSFTFPIFNDLKSWRLAWRLEG